MDKKNEKKNTNNNDINDQNSQNPANASNDNSIKEEDLKMPSATGDVKGPLAGKEKENDTTAKVKDPAKSKAAANKKKKADKSPAGENDQNAETTAKVKKPAKLNQPAKGRLEGDNNNELESKNEQSQEDDVKRLPKPKKALPSKTQTTTATNEQETGLKVVKKTEKLSKSSTSKKESKKSVSTKDKTTAKPKRDAGGRKTAKNSPGPEVKGDQGKSKKEKKQKEETSTIDALKNIAVSTAKDLADKILPDKETRDEIIKSANELMPDKKEVEKEAKKITKNLSPEIEQVNNMIDKVVPREKIKEKTEEIKKATKRIKDTSQKNQAFKDFKEMSLLSEYDIHLFKEGKHYHLYKKLGSHLMELNGKKGVYFALWAPNAKQVSVIGDFNEWHKMANPMTSRPDGSGIWEIFIPEAKQGSLYKYFVESTNGYEAEKGDPFAFLWEVPPNTASVVWDIKNTWNDKSWLAQRKKLAGKAKPVSVYEIHLGSWKRVPEEDMRSLSYRELAQELPSYLQEMGFTHVEFMPVMEHPFFGSWGYQVTGYFAPSSRFGTPQDFMFLIDSLHQAGIGVILDWVPSHFPSDLHGLHFFDGTYLFEHEDPRKGFHPDWKSYIFNFGRNEVRSFLISNALFWLDEFHVDGLRVDAVASMLYLDYSRQEGEWEPNEHGGNENLEAISFLKEFNEVVYAEFPDTMTIAEESTAWPMVSKPTYMGGLGFGMKWMMGWMHDTLEYFKNDPIHRKHHQNTITFSTNYAFTENFMLPLSHDEVVYGKGALINKMPGDEWNKFANLRALYAYMYAHPGTKLLFMGAEFGQTSEWNHDSSLDWHLTDQEIHKKLQFSVSKLNKLYSSEPALYEKSFEPEGFEWIDYNDAESSVMSFLRKGNKEKDAILVICNLTPVPRENYRIGVPGKGTWGEIFNSDDEDFGGSNRKNENVVIAEEVPVHAQEYSVSLTLPPMGVIYLKRTE